MLKTAEILNMRKSLAKESDSFAKSFAVLGDKTRYSIIELLSRNSKLCVSDLANILQTSVSAVSQHLRVLEMSGMVESNRTGKTICYRIKGDSRLEPIINLMKND
jgi:DNA-binding transcriptional ArsR family regulator